MAFELLDVVQELNQFVVRARTSSTSAVFSIASKLSRT
jgi:hypothetical protein